MSPFRIELRDPERGWLTVLVTDGRKVQEDRVSAVPADGAGELVDVLLRIASRSPMEVHSWNLEPEPWQWTMTTDEDDLLTARFAHPGRPTFEVELPRRSFLTRCWEALRLLEADPGLVSEGAWPHPFPSEAITELGERLT